MLSNRKMNLPLILSLLLLPPILCYAGNLPHPGVLSIFITIIGLWLTEAVPLPVTGLAVPVLAVLYGELPSAKAFDSFGSDILFLFLGCFLMSRSMEKHGFDKRIAYVLLTRFMPGTSCFGLRLVIVLTTYILSMWISNTSATAILCTVTVGILSSLDSQIPDETIRRRLAVRLLLGCAFAASIGGLVTPVGSPPNLIALKFLEQRGISIGFLDWIVVALPLSLAMLVVMMVVFEVFFPLRGLTFPGIKDHFRKLLAELGPMKQAEKQIACVFLIVILLWILPGLFHSAFPNAELIKTLSSRLSMSVVGLMGGLATFFMPVRTGNTLSPNLEWPETEKLEWGTLMLFGGGLTLGLLLEQSGAAKDLGAWLFTGHTMSPFMIGCLMVVTSILMSEFASNTAAASILIPLLLGATATLALSPEVTTSLVLATTFGASFGFMLPVSTPPNAIVYATGKVPASAMRKVGIWFDLAGAALILGYMLFLR